MNIKHKICREIIKFKLFVLDWKMDISVEDVLRLFISTSMINLTDLPKEVRHRFIEKSILKIKLRIMDNKNNIAQLISPIKSYLPIELKQYINKNTGYEF